MERDEEQTREASGTPDIALLLADLKADPSKGAASTHKLLAELSTLNSKQGSDVPKIRRGLDRIEAQLRDGAPSYAARLGEYVAGFRRELERETQTARRRFGAELDELLRPLDVKLQGQYPILRAAVFTLKLHPTQDRVEVWYGPEQERIENVRLSAAEVAKRIEGTLQKLGSGLDAEDFLARLRAAYRRAAQEDEDWVPITRLLPELAFLLQDRRFRDDPIREHYRSYGRADFSYDLYRCGRDEPLRGRLRLVVATRMLTASRADFLWIPSDLTGQGTMFSHLSLKESME